MARLTFPDDRSAFRPARNGQPLRSAADAPVTVYLDPAASQVAHDLLTIDGTPIDGEELAADAWSLLPLFQGPDDGRDVLYVVVDGGPVSPIYARSDDRLDALGGRVDVLEQSGPGGGSGTPTGVAGGVLSGTYPNPGFAVDMATQAELDAEAGLRVTLAGRVTIVEAALPTKADLVAGTVPDAQIHASIARDTEVTAAVAAEAAARATAISTAVNALVNGAPGLLDTLGEIATRLTDDESGAAALATTVAGKQPLNPDLTAIAGIDSTVAGALVTDGSGWFRKTYTQLKTALGLVKADVGLGNVDNTTDAGKPISTAQQTALDLKAPLASPALTGTPTVNGSPVETTTHAAGAYVAKTSAVVQSLTSLATLGSELLTNPSVASNSTGWTLAGGSSWSGGAITIPASGSISQSVAVVSGQTYVVSFAQTPWPSTGIYTIALGAATGAINAGGNSAATIVATTTGTVTFSITADATITGFALNNFSVKALTGNSLPALTVQGQTGSTRAEIRADSGNNVAVGTASLAKGATAVNNTAVGALTMQSMVTGHENVAVGFQALQNATDAEFCTAVGAGAGGLITSAYDTTAIGQGALASVTSAWANTAVGTLALTSNTANYNTAVGNNALNKNTTGTGNVAVGNGAMYTNTTSSFCTAVGTNALYQSTGTNNTALGYQALQYLTTGAANIAIGRDTSLNQRTGNNNTVVGQGAFQGSSASPSSNTGSDNTVVGQGALTANTTGGNNVAVGVQSLKSNTTGGSNTAVGNYALNTAAGSNVQSNTAIGYGALYGLTTAQNNVAVGYQAGYTATPGNATLAGGMNTYVGYQSGPGINSDPTSSTALGYRAVVGYRGLALGANTSATGNGSVAIGTDSSIVGASTSTTNQFALGTVNHRFILPGLPASTFTAGAKYVCVDAAGNLVVSATGPAS